MIKERIQKQMIASLKARKELEVRVLRFLLSEIKYAEIAKQKELTDDEIVVLLGKELKKRQEAIEMFMKGNRNDLVAEEEKQLPIIQSYLPAPLTEEEVNTLVDQTISTAGENASLGQVIGLVMSKAKGRVEARVVAQIVKEKLEK